MCAPKTSPRARVMAYDSGTSGRRALATVHVEGGGEGGGRGGGVGGSGGEGGEGGGAVALAGGGFGDTTEMSPRARTMAHEG